MKDKVGYKDATDATVQRRADAGEEFHLQGYFEAVCYGPDGVEKWRDKIKNLVTTVGKNDVLDKYLKGSSYTQTIRMGLKGNGSAAAGDTQASHAGWLEVGLANAPTYSGSRPSITMGSAAAGVSTAPSQAFSITSSGTVAGCFINNGGSATIDDTTGILLSVGDFSSGNKVVANGDTITVSYSLTAS